MFKLIVAGSRDFNDCQLLETTLDEYLEEYPPSEIEIISGGAKGADRLGKRYAQERNLACKVMPADWNKYGISAGYLRNQEMAQYADHCIVFWDGQSRGTKHMIDLSREHGLTLKIVKFQPLLVSSQSLSPFSHQAAQPRRLDSEKLTNTPTTIAVPLNFYEGNDKRPNRLFISPDRVTVHDRIVFNEAFYSVSDSAVAIYGVLSSESVGVDNTKDKKWKLDNQKALLTLYRDKKPQWNSEANKYENKEVEASENYLYGFAKDVLSKVDSGTVSIVISPYVNPAFLEELKGTPDEATIAYWEPKVKNTVVVAPTEQKLLNESDVQVVKDSQDSSSKNGSKTYQKLESESEKLEARWQFLKQHLGSNYDVKTLLELGYLLAMKQDNPEGQEEQKALRVTLDLIARMWE